MKEFNMPKSRKPEEDARMSLPHTSTSELRGRQSVRATFKLSEGCIHAISIVATHLGIKQKSLFDHLIEDTQSLNSIARELGNSSYRRQSRIQKTYVLSRRSLYSLDRISKNYNAPRDALVEFSVQRLIPIIADERAKHEKRKKALVEIEVHYARGQKMLRQIHGDFGSDDPMFQEFESVMLTYHNSYHALRDFVERGKIIEEFDPEVLLRKLTR
jgi:hypothetical protein